MGSLTRFDLEKYREFYALSHLFETGTFRGDGVAAALAAGFQRVYSVEIVEAFHRTASQRFAGDEGVSIVHGSSVEALESILPGIDGNVLFWLDAHFPGADGGISDYDSEPNESVRLPLETELETIKRMRPLASDVFLIDDLRIYERGPFDRGDLPESISRPPGGVGFIERLFSESHHVLRLFNDEGYLLLLPNEIDPKVYVVKSISEAAPKFEEGKALDKGSRLQQILPRSLLLRNLIFAILQPGIVVGLIPWLIVRPGIAEPIPRPMNFFQIAGVVLLGMGVMILISCIFRFAREGKGTISPLDPTRRLVVRGLYRYSRNPMYLGVVIALFGGALFFVSVPLFVYSAVIFIAFNLFIVYHEEPRLERAFGVEYFMYRRSVRRWL